MVILYLHRSNETPITSTGITLLHGWLVPGGISVGVMVGIVITLIAAVLVTITLGVIVLLK